MLNVDNEPPDPPNLDLSYFFGYKTEFFHFQNNRRNLDPYFKILDGSRSLGFFRKGTTHIISTLLHRSDSITCSHCREGENPVLYTNKYGTFLANWP